MPGFVVNYNLQQVLLVLKKLSKTYYRQPITIMIFK